MQVLESAGFTTGTSNHCTFNHKDRQISSVVRGDVFTALGLDGYLNLCEIIEKVVRDKGEGPIGPRLLWAAGD